MQATDLKATAGAMMSEEIAYSPDMRAIYVKQAKVRVHREMRRRISEGWPMARQMEILMAQQARFARVPLSNDAQRLVDDDCLEFPRMIEGITRIRLAAALLKKGFDEGLLDPKKFDISADKFWKGTP